MKDHKEYPTINLTYGDENRPIIKRVEFNGVDISGAVFSVETRNELNVPTEVTIKLFGRVFVGYDL